jgi:uncharacterized protein YjbI with pentapeptide repeats
MQDSIEERQEDLLERFDRLTGSNDERVAEKRQKLIDLYTASPMLFLGASYRYLRRCDPVKDVRAKQFAQILVEDTEIASLLSQENVLSRSEATLFAKVLNDYVPGIELQVLEDYVNEQIAERHSKRLYTALEIADSIDQVGRTNPILVRLLRNPNPRVRSRVVKMLVRNTANLDAALQWLADEDARVQANVLESLWEHATDRETQQIFRLYVSSKSARVATNAVIGLYKGKDQEAIPRLVRSLRYGNATFQRSSAWAMGYLKDPAFRSGLQDAVRNASPAIRGLALRALVSLQRESGTSGDGARGVDEIVSEASAVRAGPATWNAVREGKDWLLPQLDGEKLTGRTLVGADFSFCSLRGCDLSGTDLSLSNLFGADLRGANLAGAILHRCDIRCCEMNQRSNFDHASLLGTSLVGSQVTGVSARNAQIIECEGADILLG